LANFSNKVTVSIKNEREIKGNISKRKKEMEKERKEQGKLLNRKLTTVLNYRFDENS
jgi:hypothetical protein